MSIKHYHDELQDQGLSAALRAGAVRPCPRHEEVLVSAGDPDANSRAYAIATNSWKAENTVANREDLMDAVKAAIEHAADSCGRCEKDRDA